MAKKTKSWFVQKLIEMGACSEAVRYAKKHRTFPAAWNSCKDGAWLAWLIDGLGISRGHAQYCAICSGKSCEEIASLIHSRFTAERVSKALRKWTAA